MTAISAALVERPRKTERELLDAFALLSKEYGNDLGLLVMGEICELQEQIAGLEERLLLLEAMKRK
jgi:hypothetical protein